MELNGSLGQNGGGSWIAKCRNGSEVAGVRSLFINCGRKVAISTAA